MLNCVYSSSPSCTENNLVEVRKAKIGIPKSNHYSQYKLFSIKLSALFQNVLCILS